MTEDVVARAKTALEGVTDGPWEHHTAPHSDGDATHAEWLAGTLIGEGEQLHVLIAESPEPKYAYIVPAVTGDGPTSATNAEFIAAARDLVPELVAEVERWQENYRRVLKTTIANGRVIGQLRDENGLSGEYVDSLIDAAMDEAFVSKSES